MTQPNIRMKKKGFTLIEILIVVAIMFILIGVSAAYYKNNGADEQVTATVSNDNQELLSNLVDVQYNKILYETTESELPTKLYNALLSNQQLSKMRNPMDTSSIGIGLISGSTYDGTKKAAYIFTQKPDESTLPEGTVYVAISDLNKSVSNGSFENITPALFGGDIEQNGDIVYIRNSDGTIYAFGSNLNGRMGTGDTTNKFEPTKLDISNVAQVSVGLRQATFITTDNKVYIVGDNSSYEVGEKAAKTPTLVNITNVKQAFAGSSLTIYVKNDGTAWVNGTGYSGALGLGPSTTRTDVITQIPITNVEKVAGGASHTFFLKKDGTVWACGTNDKGQLGVGDTTNKTSIVKVPIDNVKDVVTKYDSTFFIKNDGSIYVTGNGKYGILGTGIAEMYTTPTKISISNVKKVVIGDTTTYFLAEDDTLYVVGKLFDWEQSLLNTTTTYTPQKLDINNIVDIGTSAFNTHIVTSDGSIYTYGLNKYGSLGIGSTNYNTKLTTLTKLNFKIN